MEHRRQYGNKVTEMECHVKHNRPGLNLVRPVGNSTFSCAFPDANGRRPRDIARIYNDLFERRQESDYMDFVVFEEAQVQPWISEVEIFVEYIINLISKSVC